MALQKLDRETCPKCGGRAEMVVVATESATLMREEPTCIIPQIVENQPGLLIAYHTGRVDAPESETDNQESDAEDNEPSELSGVEDTVVGIVRRDAPITATQVKEKCRNLHGYRPKTVRKALASLVKKGEIKEPTKNTYQYE